MNRIFAVAFVLMLVATAAVHADPAAHDVNEGSGANDPFEANGFELELGVGPFASIQRTTERRPALDDVGGHLRIGSMLNLPGASGFWRGNFEILVAAQGTAIVKGPGNLFAGGSLVVRRNFVQPDARWIPYAQLEGGFVYSDVDDDPDQRVIGQSVEFQLGGGFGLRRLIGATWAAYGEADYRHISSGGLSERNLGLNSVGVLVGIARYF